ncbi:hypothetical protein [Paenibacillus sediminis]|uniref:Uncharacterized protein n=1 Tax=Paenibacillus sediminis TaxID=664909 RepID=A0ABS4H5A0_9BACL|nr:hypothetical protein [Paenibacillus sediminis]
MPHNKSLKIRDQQNKSSILEENRTIRSKKATKYPPSLNGIPKDQS